MSTAPGTPRSMLEAKDPTNTCATFSGETGHFRIYRRLCHEAGLAPKNRARLTMSAVQTRRGCEASVTCPECRVILDRWAETTGYQRPATVRRMRPLLRWFREQALK